MKLILEYGRMRIHRHMRSEATIYTIEEVGELTGILSSSCFFLFGMGYFVTLSHRGIGNALEKLDFAIIFVLPTLSPTNVFFFPLVAVVVSLHEKSKAFLDSSNVEGRLPKTRTLCLGKPNEIF